MTRVLVIEDEESLRLNVSEILMLEGYSTLEAENGVIGVQLARDYLPDLIICDIMMPELDGYGVLLELRSDPATATIPFIFLTAKADRGAMRYGMELGADDYVSKPFAQDEIVTAVRVRLEKHALMAREFEQRLDELRQNLISALPHELRTPLTGILGYSEMLAMDSESLDGQEILRYATMIKRAGQRLHRLIENYLMFAQIELVKNDPQRVTAFREHITDTPGAIIEGIAWQKAEAASRANDLVVEVADSPVRIAEDSLRKIVEELIDNAFKFSAQGSPVQVRAGLNGRVFALQISDQGRGMTPDQIRQLGPYVQFERKLYEQQGTGMGLTIAKRLTELFAGDLTIESAPNQMTTILVTLPAG